MSSGFEDAEFWLPSEFLKDEDILMDNKENLTSQFCFPTEFPYEFNDSVVNSSDEEDQLAELTRQLSLQRSHNPYLKQKSCWDSTGSPQSTLAQLGGWTGWSPGSSNGGSPNGPSQVTSPSTTPSGAINDPRDLVYQAAGQIARLKINCIDAPIAKTRVVHGLQHRPPATLHNPNTSFHDSYIRAMREKQISRQEQQQRCAIWPNGLEKNIWAYHQNRGGAWFESGVEDGECCRGKTAWPSLQYMRQPNQHTVSGMREVSPGGGPRNVGVKKKCSGTGVFLPRSYGNNNSNNYSFGNISKPAESRKRPGYPPALVPARVVQALNKSFSDLNGSLVHSHCVQQQLDDSYFPVYEALVARRNALLMMQQQRHRQLQAQGMMKHGQSLPQEWTY